MINAQTKVFATLANPNRQSLAPIMHNAAFRQLGLNNIYVAFEPENIADGLPLLGRWIFRP